MGNYSRIVSKSFICDTVPATAGGAMTITEYLHVHVFRAGLLTHMTFGADWILSWFNMLLALAGLF